MEAGRNTAAIAARTVVAVIGRQQALWETEAPSTGGQYKS